MFSRILIASELSPISCDMIKYLKGLRKLGAKECLLVQCINPHQIEAKISSFFNSVMEGILENQKEILIEQGYNVHTRIVTGFTKTVINRIAVEEDFSVIVAGAAEHTIMGEIILGGAAHEVIHNAEKPVLLVRVSDKFEKEFEDITDHILFPTDFSENANHAFEYLIKMVEDGAKKVTLLNVQEHSKINDDMSYHLEEFNYVDTPEEVNKAQFVAEEHLKKHSDIEEAKLQQMKKMIEEKGDAEVHMQKLYGSPSAEILKFIREGNISLVVMGSQGRGFIKEIYLGSVSHNISRHSESSVLLIPAKR
jgi:nucleotide-binding universal stress UspA family protein